MHKKLLLSLLWLFLTVFTSFAQNTKPKAYFDKSGRYCSESIAHYYRQETDTPGYYKSYFLANGNLAFQGHIKSLADDEESKNTFTGTCYWYYKNKNPRQVRTFDNNGDETGTSKYYYESGKIWKEIDYYKGKPASTSYVEYNENGTKNKIFEDSFVNNNNEWDLFTGDKSSANIANGQFVIHSTSREGTSRYINYPIESDEYTIEASFNTAGLKENEKVGIIYGFKNWENYHYFAISQKNIYIGSFYEGVKVIYVDAMFSSAITQLQDNTLKILCNGEKEYYSINGEIQHKEDKQNLYGNNFGFVLSGNSTLKVNDFIIKQMDISGPSGGGNGNADKEDRDVRATGSGLIFSENGYIITNHHVVENFNKFIVELTNNSQKMSCNAELVLQDKENDLAILKIKDDRYKNIQPLQYAFKSNGLIDLGTVVFTIGYPHALSGMGKDAKFTDGKVSSKTGYNGSINSFQTTIPVQPGNSGGPVFNEEGQLVGLINATIKEADNVSYAIKLNSIKNLIELLPEKIELPKNTSLVGLTLEEKLKILPNYVVLIKVK